MIVDILDPEVIPTGFNNELISEISFEVGQVDYKTVYLFLTDH